MHLKTISARKGKHITQDSKYVCPRILTKTLPDYLKTTYFTKNRHTILFFFFLAVDVNRFRNIQIINFFFFYFWKYLGQDHLSENHKGITTNREQRYKNKIGDLLYIVIGLAFLFGIVLGILHTYSLRRFRNLLPFWALQTRHELKMSHSTAEDIRV